MIARMKSLGIDQWNPSERLALLEEIWGSLAPEQLPLTPQQRTEIERRIKDYEEQPGNEISWEDAKAKALAKIA